MVYGSSKFGGRVTPQSESVKFLRMFPNYYRGGEGEYYLERGCESLAREEIIGAKTEFAYILNGLNKSNAEKFLSELELTDSPETYRRSIELIIYALEILSRHAGK